MEIAGRFRDVAEKFGGPSQLARELSVSPQVLNDYLSGRTLPGLKMRARLEAIGVDMMWLINGRTAAEVQAEFEKRAKHLRPANGLSDEDHKMVGALHRLGIKTLSDLMLSLDETIVGDRILAERRRAIEESRKRANNDRSPRESKKK